MRNIILVLSCMLAMNIVGQNQHKLNDVNVSNIEVIANPEKFHDKTVAVCGFFVLYDTGFGAIYLSENDYKNGLNKNALIVKISDDQAIKSGKVQEFDKNYISVTGDFQMYEKYNHYSGTIYNCHNLFILPKN